MQFKKYTTGVYCLETETDDLTHGSVVEVTTRHGKNVAVMIWKKLLTKAGKTYYSYVREDGMDRKAWQARKVEKLQNAAARQNELSDSHYAKSNQHRDFLSLGEPIKVGHHSERRHRKLFEDANRHMAKCVEASRKADGQLERAETIESRLAYEINLDTPDSLELLTQRVQDLEHKRDALKASGNYESFQLSNLGANIRRYKERLATAQKLWELPPQLSALAQQKQEG
ncbi:DUF3560 domain-containing protein [Rhizobium sp. Rhizsp82]|uniref:DUF3560 domain-containing protein n=1 Tax=Rhizobium sp. Rhizsp82 TaxID=3243057 RepID=UPI0039B507FB